MPGVRSRNESAWLLPNDGTTWRTDATTQFHSSTGSFSDGSSDTNANARGSAASHWASSVDLPNPGGAVTTVSRPSDFTSRCVRRDRSTSPDRSAGDRNFGANTTARPPFPGGADPSSRWPG